MNCKHLRDLFSDLFEDRLDAVARARAHAHLAGCADCSADYESFCQATAALRGAAAEPTPAGYVDAILVAVEEESRPAAVPVPVPLPWRRWATHLAAAAAGALIAFLWLRDAGTAPVESTGGEVAQTAGAEQAFQLQLSAGSGLLDRDGRTRELAPDQVVALRAGDVLRAERIGALELALDEHGRLRLALPAFVAPPPVVVERPVDRIVERIVERPVDRIVERPVEVIREVPVSGPGSQAIARQLGRGVAVLEDGVAVLRDVLARPRVEPLAVAPASEGPARGAVVAERSEETPPDLPAVRIRREGDRLRLDTRGPLSEVVPTLIAQLDSNDPEIVELVQRRLESIRDASLDSFGWIESAAAEQPARATSLASLLFGDAGEPTEPALDRTEQWSVWWEAQAVRLADAAGERVF